MRIVMWLAGSIVFLFLVRMRREFLIPTVSDIRSLRLAPSSSASAITAAAVAFILAMIAIYLGIGIFIALILIYSVIPVRAVDAAQPLTLDIVSFISRLTSGVGFVALLVSFVVSVSLPNFSYWLLGSLDTSPLACDQSGMCFGLKPIPDIRDPDSLFLTFTYYLFALLIVVHLLVLKSYSRPIQNFVVLILHLCLPLSVVVASVIDIFMGAELSYLDVAALMASVMYSGLASSILASSFAFLER